ncbi:MAG: hypothetical protein Q9186_002557 [Xanthomendoza sp. 1 TL-2023]
MCIHHLTYHAPCGHHMQLRADVVYCNPVFRAIQFYHEQPERPPLERLDTMKCPQPCGRDLIKLVRNITFVGNPHDIKPEGWMPCMTTFTKTLLAEGEDVEEVVIILETKYPHLVGKISGRWIHHLRDCFNNHDLLWYPGEDLHNDDSAGHIVTETVERGCGRLLTGDSGCSVGWDNPYGGGKLHCPYILSHETGQQMSWRPEYDASGQSFKAKSEPTFHHQFHREMRLQAWDSIKEHGQDLGDQQQGYASLKIDPRFLVSPVQSHTAEKNDENEIDRLVAGLRASTVKGYCWPSKYVSKKGKCASDNGLDDSADVGIERGRPAIRTSPNPERARTVTVMEPCKGEDCGCHAA